jgi:DNA-binding IclR family transcriptional regulator
MIKINGMSFALLVKALRIGDKSLADLADASGLHYLTVAYYVRELRKAGEIHVSRLRSDSIGRLSVKLYTLGPGIDAKRDPLSARERKQRQRARESREEAVRLAAAKRPRKPKPDMLAVLWATAPTEPLPCTAD